MNPYLKKMTKFTLFSTLVVTAHQQRWLPKANQRLMTTLTQQLTEQLHQMLPLSLTLDQRQQWLHKWQTFLRGHNPKLATKRQLFLQALDTLAQAQQTVFVGYETQAPDRCWYGPLYRLQGTSTYVVFDPEQGTKRFQLVQVTNMGIGLEVAAQITIVTDSEACNDLS